MEEELSLSKRGKPLTQYEDDDDDMENQYSTENEITRDEKTNMFAFEIRN
jgi:hypothetical protein